VAADTCLVILRTADELLAQQPRRVGPLDAFRGVWLLVGLVAAGVFAMGLAMTFSIEPTHDALAEAARGEQLLVPAGVAIVLLALVGPVLGTRLWTTLLILPAPVVTGALYAYDPHLVWSYLAALVLGPVACLGGILAVALPRRTQR
jgi:hypothetical protein